MVKELAIRTQDLTKQFDRRLREVLELVQLTHKRQSTIASERAVRIWR
jgi:hypothetical protein